MARLVMIVFCLWLSLAALSQITPIEKRGFEALSQSRYDDALDAFEELLSREPDRAETGRRLVTLYSQLQRDEQAARHFGEATSDPSRSIPEAEFQYGRALEPLGQTEPAVEHYRRALSKDPRLLRARFRLGNLLLRTGDTEEGQAVLRGYEEFRQWDRRVKLLLSMVTSGTLPEAAKKERTLELVDLLIQGGALEDAEALIRSALAIDPYDVDFRVAEIEWLLSSRELERARESVEMLQFVADPPSELYWLSGRIYLLQGNSQEAIKDFENLRATVSDPPASLLKDLATPTR